MKKKLLICLLLCSYVVGGAMAQEEQQKAKGKFSFGLETGLNISTFNQNDALQSKKVGYNLGVTFEYMFPKRVVIETGLFWTTKGTINMTNWADRPIGNMNIRLSYLELPLTIGYKFRVADNINIVPKVGCYFSCGLTGSVDIEGHGVNEYNVPTHAWGGNYSNPFTRMRTSLPDINVDIDPFKRFDSGLRFGVNAEVYGCVLGFSYDLGLYKIHETFPLGGEPLYNRSFSVSIGYKF